MTWTPITGAPTKYSVDDTDYWLKFYKAGTVTPISVAINANGDSPLAKVKINPNGYPISNPLDDTTVFIPYIDQDYRIVLYLSETDADNNNTANADFNVDGVIQNIAPSGTATDVSLRQTTLLVQDDYDRSPLFVDGEDFTAGAGPHVITVPAGWTPSGTDTRFYKKDASGIITNLTPTAKDSTTFTLAETLLSTDEVFIGDNAFRNQIDGDPKAIRERLSVSTTSESDARYLLESNNLSDLVSDATARTNLDVYSKGETDTELNAKQNEVADVAGYLKAETVFITDGENSSEFSVSGTIGELVWVSVGPTGSGATSTWTALDGLPSDTKFIDVLADLVDSSGGSTLVSTLYSRAYGSSTGFGAESQIAELRTSATLTSITMLSQARIPLDGQNRFEIGYNTNSGSGSAAVSIRGFGV